MQGQGQGQGQGQPAQDAAMAEAGEEDEGEEEDEETVFVQGRPVPLSEVTDADQDNMTEEEHQNFFAACNRAREG